MRAASHRLILIAFWTTICVLAFSVGVSPRTARAQDQPQTTSGPKPNVGEGVVIPKKTAPANVPPPTEKKPEKINPSDIYTLSTTTNLVNVDVLVTTQDGQPIPGLTKKNFEVYDDGVEQNVTNFGISKAPMTVAMLVEFSANYWDFLYLALQGAYEFVNFTQPQDWVAVIDFDLKPHILSDFTHDRSQIRGALDQMRVPGFSESNLYDALAFTLDRMKDVQGRKAILLIGTGCDTFSKLNYGDILKIVKTSDTVIYPVSIYEFLTVRYGDNIPCSTTQMTTPGFGGSMMPLQARNTFQSIAKLSGGQAYFPRFEGELPDIYRQIAGQLRTQYSLGFIPTNPAKDGRFHKLKVDVVGAEDKPLIIKDEKGKKIKYRVVSRDGYYAPKS